MLLPETVDEILPLSPVQSGMLFHAVSEDADRGAYVGVVSLTLDGPLDSGRFRKAFETAVAARDVFRASFVYRDIKRPLQVIHKTVEIPWTELDFSSLADEERFVRGHSGVPGAQVHAGEAVRVALTKVENAGQNDILIEGGMSIQFRFDSQIIQVLFHEHNYW